MTDVPAGCKEEGGGRQEVADVPAGSKEEGRQEDRSPLAV